MASPFPGMDPYLEGHLWTSVHAELATVIAHQLMPRLRPKYVALPERQYIAGAPEDVMISAAPLVPDVGIRKARARSGDPGPATVIAPSLKLRTRLATSVPHFQIEIRDSQQRTLVTAIELLSPTNKRSGRREYLRKRRRFLKSSAHLLEIDLHHQGRRVPLLDPYPPGAYFVLLNRARRRSVTEVWPIAIRECLPTVRVPLLKPDPDVALNLQEALSTVYEAGGFDLIVDYRDRPDVELPTEEAVWVEERLRDAGYRG
jgi:Protein of unknown function (DUF4058)